MPIFAVSNSPDCFESTLSMTSQTARSVLKPSLPTLCPVADAVALLAEASIEARGAIFTRGEVVDFVLDCSGYTADRPLHRMRLLEPSFGEGDFLLPVIDRLLAAWQAGRKAVDDPVAVLSNCVRAVELHRTTSALTRQAVISRLTETHGLDSAAATALADSWLIQGDFLLVDLPGRFDFVTGNPPYVRQEMIPDALMAAYRDRYATIYDRADLYIPFIERSLTQLEEGGHLGFICADRWMKNRYGGPLRKLVAAQFHLKIYVDMFGTPAFHTEVIAYPAIIVIARTKREKARPTRIAHRPEIDAAVLTGLARKLTSGKLAENSDTVREIEGIASGAEPWILESSDQLALMRRLEAEFPLLEDAGCKVGIGVATGADAAFIGPFDTLDVEADRKLPLVMTGDIIDGTVKWRGLGVINPFAETGGLVSLADYPRLRAYLEARKPEIDRRHVAQKVPANWYRTIDRITPSLATKPKLLIPDIKGKAHVVYEDGRLYPHHNLYFVTSEVWDLKALQAVFLSGIAKLFVGIYSTRMHGGFLRFQAQYLRRIRLPRWHQVSDELKQALVTSAEHGDHAACNRAVFELYGLDAGERATLGGNGE